ncbi:unnamed protein product [Urochloa decumbens]|uniref:MARVEL domain-containing protein n=1 Tax=Urochloa decumbens TaxID=240449 RepID=A0ABC9A155_9POAL
MAFSSSAPMSVPSPSPPPRPALAPREPRSRRLALVAADMLMCFCLATSWTCFASHVTAVIAERTCREDKYCLVVEVALHVYGVAGLTSVLAVLAFALLLSNTGTWAEKKELLPGFRRIVMVEVVFFIAFALLLDVGAVLMRFPPRNSSHARIIASDIFDGGVLGLEIVTWFIMFPSLALSARRMSREAAAQAEIGPPALT